MARGVRRGGDVDGAIEYLVNLCSEGERAYEQQTGRTLTGARALEIGPGTATGQLLYFSQKCDAVGIDLDYIPTNWNPLNYLRILRANGLKRLLKTLGRKLLVSDREFRYALRTKLGLTKLRPARVIQMDATQMRFDDASFDFVYSFNVFEHIPNPAAVFEEIRRVLKPGGVAFTHLHLFTCDSGFHDLRIIAGQREGVPYWAHLRPSQRHLVRASSYLNELRLGDWLRILHEHQPDGSISYLRDAQLVDELCSIRDAGELAEFSDDELLINSVICAWRKSAATVTESTPAV